MAKLDDKRVDVFYEKLTGEKPRPWPLERRETKFRAENYLHRTGVPVRFVRNQRPTLNNRDRMPTSTRWSAHCVPNLSFSIRSKNDPSLRLHRTVLAVQGDAATFRPAVGSKSSTTAIG